MHRRADTIRARLVAVDHVEIEARPASREALQRFYAELIGFEPMASAEHDDPDGQVLRFRGERFELRILLREAPRLQAVDARVHIEAAALEETIQALDDQRYPYEWTRGLSFTARSLSLLDPGGNRVELRKLWPYHPL